ncbi:MAG: sigma-70 family RNA polymerase sigma factor [Ktedonobacteraceae bacterium]|nr:sigma-70 family RNA polymerase sigma factor [Chloroflexota bacterium]
MAEEHATFGRGREEAVYRQHAPQIFAYLLRHVPSPQDAEDLLLEVFLPVLEKLPTLDERRLAAYLQTVARNKIADYYRQRDKYQFIPLDEIAETIYERDELAPEQLALAHEQGASLQQSVSTLPEIQQTILRLRFSHGLRCGEIATRLARSESSVRMMLSRSLKALRDLRSVYEER